MAEEQPTLAEKARAAIRHGQLPSRAPNRRFGGRGNGATCPVCGEVVTPIQAEIEIEFKARPGAWPGPVSSSRPVLHHLGGRAPQDSGLGDVAQYHQCMRTIALLSASNVFMAAAWYGHLRFRESALWKVILVSWLLAFFEYCLQVPANRIGYGQFTATQLKIIQEVITLLVFVAFAWLYLGERLRWNEAVAFALVLGAVVVANLPA
jgi:uncharacterized protein (DUF486 family)